MTEDIFIDSGVEAFSGYSIVCRMVKCKIGEGLHQTEGRQKLDERKGSD